MSAPDVNDSGAMLSPRSKPASRSLRELVKRVAPSVLVDGARRTRARLLESQAYAEWTEHVLYVFSRSRALSALYYSLFSGAFRREQHAVLTGRWRYQKQSRSSAGHDFQLRRDTHRLEKGLIMRPRRDVFARDYIGATVDSYSARLSDADERGRASDPDVCWSGNVLERYFSEVGADPAVDAARARFPGRAPDAVDRPMAPFRRNLDDPSPVSYENLLRLARRRRSVRWFLPRPVDRAEIDKALIIAAESPSACNRQPYEFRIFDSPERVRRVGRLALGSNGFEHNFPALAVLVGQQRAYFDERDRHVIYIDASLAAMSFVLALETLGLSSCCLNWPDREDQEAKMQRTLDLKADERVIMLIAFGYPDPDGLVPASGKKDLTVMRSYEPNVY